MKKLTVWLAPFSILLATTLHLHAGTLFYVAIPAQDSDIGSGISNANQYTSAVDGGNTRGTDRVINGITLYSLVGSGASATADNCTVNALAGTLTNASGSTDAIAADGAFKDVASDMTFNNGATDNSQQEIVLDPASLVAGTTYDLRIYVANGAGQDRQVNLSFVGDGQSAVETGFFNEDDARTSAGGFQDPNQAYYINYRFTWDGQSTPGVTVTQKFGQTPFVLYALTNQPVGQEGAAGGTAETGATTEGSTTEAGAGVAAAAGGTGINTGLVTAQSDQVGVTTDTFYSNESLNRNGDWIEIKKYGRCWQPRNCPVDWRPYWRGSFSHCDDCGYTWVCDPSEEEWGWACYHYGRWCRVPGIGCGWAWVPGTVWSGAWVSWRQGQTSDCTCVGWAPLPPEATCRVGVGISTWVDRECNIGPECYTFVHVRYFGSSSYERCGCILERNRYVNIVEHTTNITNISYVNVNIRNVTNVNVTNINIYNGGPNFNWCNTEIKKFGGKEISQVHVNVVTPEDLKGGKGQHLEGNTLTMVAPKITPEKNPKFIPTIKTTIDDNKIDHGWSGIKDPKLKTDLQNKIAEQSKGQTPLTTKATLPTDVAEKLKIHPLGSPSPGQSPLQGITKLPLGAITPTATPGGKVAGKPFGLPTATVSPAGSPLGGKGLHPGKLTLQSPTPGASPTGTVAGKVHPGGKFTPLAGQSPTGTPGASPTGTAFGKGQHPGGKFAPLTTPSPTGTVVGAKGLKGVATPQIQPLATGTPIQSPTPGGQHPGQKTLKGTVTPQLGTPTPTPGGQKVLKGVATPQIQPLTTATPIQTPSPGGQHPGQKGLKGVTTPQIGQPLITPTPVHTPTPGPQHTPLTIPKVKPTSTIAPGPLGGLHTPTPTATVHLQNIPTGIPKSTPPPTPSGPSKEQLLQQQKLHDQQLQQQKLLQQQQQQKLLQQQQQQKLLEQQKQQQQLKLQQQQQQQLQQQKLHEQQLQQQKLLQQQQQQKLLEQQKQQQLINQQKLQQQQQYQKGKKTPTPTPTPFIR